MNIYSCNMDQDYNLGQGNARHILSKYNLDAEKISIIVDQHLFKNISETAEDNEIGRATVTNYRDKVEKMSKLERNKVILECALKNIVDLKQQKAKRNLMKQIKHNEFEMADFLNKKWREFGLDEE